MKSKSIYILAIIFLSAMLLAMPCNQKIPDGVKEMQVYAYSTPILGEGDGVDKMTNFNIYHYYGKVVSIKDFKLDNTLGVAYIYAKDNMSIDTLMDKLSIDVIYTQKLEDGITYYGKSNAGGRSVYIDRKEINVQIVSNKDNIIVGFPLIMGSY